MSHHHDHHHGAGHHHHTHDTETEMTFEQKLDKILHHWKHHNDDHANTYKRWQEQAEAEGFSAVAVQLEKAADLTLEINRLFEAAIAAIKEKT